MAFKTSTETPSQQGLSAWCQPVRAAMAIKQGLVKEKGIALTQEWVTKTFEDVSAVKM